jgi:hypothetical protein
MPNETCAICGRKIEPEPRYFTSDGKPRHMLCEHNCDENVVPYESDGALGHGWECGVCGTFLQAG